MQQGNLGGHAAGLGRMLRVWAWAGCCGFGQDAAGVGRMRRMWAGCGGFGSKEESARVEDSAERLSGKAHWMGPRPRSVWKEVMTMRAETSTTAARSPTSSTCMKSAHSPEKT